MAALLKPGDTVSCRIKEAQIVSSYSSFDFEETFQIVASDDEGYFRYTPDHFVIDDTCRRDTYRASILNIKKPSIDAQIAYVSPSQIAAIKFRLDGMTCTK